MIKYHPDRKNPISIILFIKSLESIMSFTYLTTEELQWLTGENIWLVYETPRLSIVDFRYHGIRYRKKPI